MMEIIWSLLRLGYVIIFFIAVFISLKFEWSKENKDERGQSISNASYRFAFPFLPIGWLFITLYDDFISSMDYETYKLAIWYLLTGTFILQASMVTVLRKKY